jgi:hypothetical protein
MKTIITTLLYAITTLSSYAAVILSDVSYDINIQFEEDKYVEDWSYVPATKTYYEVLEVTAEKAGTYNFYNYNSELYGLLGPTVDTQLLIYDVAPDFIIIDGPWAFNNGPGAGFGGGQENVSFSPFDVNLSEPNTRELMVDMNGNPILPIVDPAPTDLILDQPNNGIFGNEAFDASITFSAGQSYTIVFSSFQPDAFGSMNVEIHGPSELGISAIPEPTTYALLAGFVAFLYIAIKKRK